jgi:hypothetical protein
MYAIVIGAGEAVAATGVASVSGMVVIADAKRTSHVFLKYGWGHGRNALGRHGDEPGTLLDRVGVMANPPLVLHVTN